ncbi:arginase family protein [Pseudomonas sp. CIP-10]|uniref:arginase family protein n=1 Tax=Pseudomonas sp. CIP-10 TaxID=2892442 RepID=UPI001E5A13D8|nr:arginase family protein [Pseudomonas sp. CIP-10]UFH30025.1 arginase family protein [Pseudomonas sp. CIP-10]
MNNSNTLRLLFPQWQGGNNPPYHFGAQLLAWLAPETLGPVEEVPVALPGADPLPLEAGIRGRTALLEQMHAAKSIIDRHQPDRLVVLGGDCLVDLAPFAYLNERYAGDLAVLWVDAHPDILTPEQFAHAHAMVLGNLLGEGDAQFTEIVAQPLKPTHVMYAGVHSVMPWEAETIARFGLQLAGPDELAESSDQVLKWFASTGAKHLAIHLDLDVLDPASMRSLLFANPQDPLGAFDGVAQGKMRIPQVLKLLKDIASIADVVGIGIAEHLPWDALAMRDFLAQLPLIGNAGKRS